jgi:hypothetical protein
MACTLVDIKSQVWSVQLITDCFNAAESAGCVCGQWIPPGRKLEWEAPALESEGKGIGIGMYNSQFHTTLNWQPVVTLSLCGWPGFIIPFQKKPPENHREWRIPTY